MLEQLAVILPEVAAYEAGLLDFLLRGELTITAGRQISVTGAPGSALGAGTVEVLVEDDRGVRTSIVSVATPGSSVATPGSSVATPGTGAAAAGTGAPLASVAAPATGTRVVAVFRGVDAAGEPIVAVGAMPLTH